MTGITSRTKIKANIYLLTSLGMFVFLLTGAFAQGKIKENVDLEGDVNKPGISYTADKFRDPFVNSVQADISIQSGGPKLNIPEVPLPPMVIQGIFWGGKFPQAIINEKIVKVGEKIDGAQILSIEKDSVTVFFGTKNFVLPSPASNNLADSSNKNDVKRGGS